MLIAWADCRTLRNPLFPAKLQNDKKPMLFDVGMASLTINPGEARGGHRVLCGTATPARFTTAIALAFGRLVGPRDFMIGDFLLTPTTKPNHPQPSLLQGGTGRVVGWRSQKPQVTPRTPRGLLPRGRGSSLLGSFVLSHRDTPLKQGLTHPLCRPHRGGVML